ncbi:ABC transporter substrate-binding protein [Paracoccus onubensis]|uniref:ABC transporter substrate-binding protein n=1 Tax=Paracoccus onubensis TaxID=1675788 RepID=UPI002730D303|nr:ABC transporter substrate-binding protein [Paracoccus onubensis]MDP0926633.1 ABC transporter substrate-binding protein [Paracoccus onubensis]
MVIRTQKNGAWRAGGIIFIAALAFTLLLAATARAEITLTDATGRKVVLDQPASHIGINEADLILSLMLLTDDPVAPIAVWGSAQRLDPGIKAALRAKFPQIDQIPEAGSATPSDFSVEGVVAQAPDLYVIRIFDPMWEPVRKRLEAAGIPVIYLDSPDLQVAAPEDRVIFSLTLLGDAIGQGQRAREYAEFIAPRYAQVARLVADAPARPPVLVDGHATPDCCWVPGAGNRLGDLVDFAGGQIVGSELVSDYAGQIAAEHILAADPQVLIATGGPHLQVSHGLVLGVGRDEDSAQASLDSVLATGIRPELSAVREGRAHGILHLLTISPFEVLAVETFARWIHPEAADDIDPAETLAEMNQRFLPVPLEGTFWVDQQAAP